MLLYFIWVTLPNLHKNLFQLKTDKNDNFTNSTVEIKKILDSKYLLDLFNMNIKKYELANINLRM